MSTQRPSVKHFNLKRENVYTNVASLTVNYKTSLLFYDNYFKSPVFNNIENNCNTNTLKSILGQFYNFIPVLICGPCFYLYIL